MAAKKKAKSRREIQAAFNGRDLKVNGKGVPLRSQAEEALQCYFETLNGHKPAHLYDPKFDRLSPASRKARGARANRENAD